MGKHKTAILLTVIAIAIVVPATFFTVKAINNYDAERQAEAVAERLVTLGAGIPTDSQTTAIIDTVFTDYADYESVTSNIKLDHPLTAADFEDHNYAIVVVRNRRDEKYTFTPSNVIVENDSIYVTIDYQPASDSNPVSDADYLYFAFKLNKSESVSNVIVNYVAKGGN